MLNLTCVSVQLKNLHLEVFLNIIEATIVRMVVSPILKAGYSLSGFFLLPIGRKCQILSRVNRMRKIIISFVQFKVQMSA